MSTKQSSIEDGIPGYTDLAGAAEIIGVHPSQVWRYVDSGKLKGRRVGSMILVRVADAKRFKRPPRGNPHLLAAKRKITSKQRPRDISRGKS